jgi:hypothetical protein
MRHALAILFLGLAVLGGTTATVAALSSGTAYGDEGTGPCRGNFPGPCPW